MTRLTKNPGEDTEKNVKLSELTARIIIEVFLQCADDDTFTFEDTVRILKGFMLDGYYKTMAEAFRVKNLRFSLFD